MAHYAKVVDGAVVNVIVAEKNFIDTLPDAGAWVKTSYNMRGGVYYDAVTNLPHPNQEEMISGDEGRQRKNYAGYGFTYDVNRDAFIPPKPFSSWALNEETCLWEAPVPMPEDEFVYRWDEDGLQWVKEGE